jgi:hypothetical protein
MSPGFRGSTRVDPRVCGADAPTVARHTVSMRDVDDQGLIDGRGEHDPASFIERNTGLRHLMSRGSHGRPRGPDGSGALNRRQRLSRASIALMITTQAAFLPDTGDTIRAIHREDNRER